VTSSKEERERRGKLNLETERVRQGQEMELPSNGRMREVLTSKEKKEREEAEKRGEGTKWVEQKLTEREREWRGDSAKPMREILSTKEKKGVRTS